MGHALGLFLAHAVHIARASAAHMRHTLRAGPGGGAVLGAAGAAGDIAMLWAILQVLTAPEAIRHVQHMPDKALAVDQPAGEVPDKGSGAGHPVGSGSLVWQLL